MTEYVKKADVFNLLNTCENVQQAWEGFSRMITYVFGAGRKEDMEIKTFAEMTQEVWSRIRVPVVAVYQRERDAARKPYLVKVYDGGDYTGIWMQADTMQQIRADLAANAGRLQDAGRGEEDEPELVCAYV